MPPSFFKTNHIDITKHFVMKKILLTLLVLCCVFSAMAQGKEESKEQKLISFTTVKENPITSIKNQSRSGTCWDFATVAFFEGEILKKTGKVYDLCEMFVANKNYMDQAIYHVRMHGCSRFSEGGSADDVVWVMANHGICPEDAMPAPGSLIGDSLSNFTEFFKVLTPYVETVAKSETGKLTSQWKVGVQGILDAYLGKCPERFTYQGREYTPRSFFNSLNIDLDDYISVTSYTHHPFYTWFNIEAPYKWRQRLSYNVPLDEMMNLIDTALDNGYNVCWGGDVSEDGFTRTGLGIAADVEHAPDLTGSDAARWLKLSRQEKAESLKKMGASTPELVPTQELRQERFDNWESTYDHVMVIYGVARDQNGREYYMVKNSWGKTGDYEGIWYMSKAFIALNTTYVFFNRNAIPGKLNEAYSRILMNK